MEKMKLIISLLYCLQTLTCIQGLYRGENLGCFEDSNERALSGDSYNQAKLNTVERCINFCGEGNYTYAGLQYGRSCYCGNSGYDAHSKSDDAGHCNYDCTGNKSQECGGNFRNSVYKIEEYKITHKYVGCFDNTNLSFSDTTEDSYNQTKLNTVERCINFCGERSYTYAGLQSSSLCFCSNSGYDEIGKVDGCNHTCPGNNNQICDGHFKISVYEVAVVPLSLSNASTTTTEEFTSLEMSTVTLSTTVNSIKDLDSSTNPVEALLRSYEEEEVMTVIYISVGVEVLSLCFIFALVGIIVYQRRQINRIKNALTLAQDTESPTSGVETPSSSTNPGMSARSANAVDGKHYLVNGDVYAAVQVVQQIKQPASSHYEDVGAYSLAGPINDHLVVEENPFYEPRPSANDVENNQNSG